MPFGVMNTLEIHICQDAQEAVDKGHVYKGDTKPIEIDRVVIVREGTESGKSTVDLVLKTADGQQFVCMITGALLKSIPC